MQIVKVSSFLTKNRVFAYSIIEQLKLEYPKLFGRLPKDISALRYILIIDENFNDVDSDEFDDIDPEDFNYMVYLTDLLQESIGKEVLHSLPEKYIKQELFEDFHISQNDLYGVLTKESEDTIAKIILDEIEDAL